PEARATCVMQERTGCPSSRTVQAPHWPSPQPYLLPVRCRSFRNTDSKLAVASTSTVIFLPLTFRSLTLAIKFSSESAGRYFGGWTDYNSAFATYPKG